MTGANEAGGYQLSRSSVLFLVPAALLSLALMPDDMTLIPIFMLSFARAIALVLGFVCLIATGRLDRWLSFRLLLALMAIGGIVVVTFVCLCWQMINEDTLPPPYSIIYIVLARALPFCLMASVFLPSKKLFLSSVACAFVMGVVFSITIDPLSQAYSRQKAEANRIGYEAAEAARQARLTQRMADLSRVPAEAGPEALLPFIDEHEPEEVQEQARAKLDGLPNVADQLAKMLDGDRRLDALIALNLGPDNKFDVPEAIKQRSWIVAASIARELTPRMENPAITDDEVKLCRAMNNLSLARTAALAVRNEHRDELLALRQWLLIAMRHNAQYCGNGVYPLDSILQAP